MFRCYLTQWKKEKLLTDVTMDVWVVAMVLVMADVWVVQGHVLEDVQDVAVIVLQLARVLVQGLVIVVQ